MRRRFLAASLTPVRFRRALALGAASVLIGMLLFSGGEALADGDPASDVLLGENVFYPYSPPVSSSLARRLDALTAAAKKAGFPVKVALIAGPVDLGVIPDLFGQPQRYAAFLDQEISFNVKQPLVVVMPAGFGGAGLSAPVMSALSRLGRPTGGKTDALAMAAIDAVPRLAAAAGHPFKAPGASAGAGAGAGSGSSGGILVFALPLLLVGVVVGLLTLRTRARERDPRDARTAEVGESASDPGS